MTESSAKPDTALSAATPPPAGSKNYDWLIKAAALICGTAVMALEMVGVRLLEPYLGSTIYVWGAIIGIFLGSLSLGYYLGGRCADYSPRFSTLGTMIFAAALWIFGVPSTAGAIGTWSSSAFTDPRWQAFFASLILYAAPSILLGMVSPFLVRLAARNIANMGRTAGSIYALSTFGSIIGTFLVSFVLTEYIGSMSITWGTGAILLAGAILCWTAERSSRTLLLSFIGVILALGGWQAAAAATSACKIATGFTRLPADSPLRVQENGRHLEMRESAYHLINVFDGQYDFAARAQLPAGQSARYMVFNDQLESGCLVESAAGGNGDVLPVPLSRTQTACGYVRLLMLGAVISGKTPDNIAIIGCGGGVGAMMFCDDYPAVKRIDVADIDPHVFALAGKYFGYPYPDRADSPIRSHVIDGRQLLRQAPAENWDYIILDAYTAGGRIPKHLVSREFFELAGTKLAGGGVVVANIISSVEGGPNGRLFAAVLKTARKVFKHVYVFPRSLSGASNIILVASNHPGDRRPAARLWEDFRSLTAKGIIKQPVDYAVRNSPAGDFDLAAAPVLTDDFCPTDSMIVR